MIKDKITELIIDAGFGTDLVTDMQNNGYFKAPGHKKGNYAVEGGLAVMSYEVTTTMLKLNESLNLGLRVPNIILSGLFFNLRAVSCFQENILKSGLQSDKIPYNYRPSLIMQRGPDSLYILQNNLNMRVPVDVATAIAYHQPLDEKDIHEKAALEHLRQQPTAMTLVWLLWASVLFIKNLKAVRLKED